MSTPIPGQLCSTYEEVVAGGPGAFCFDFDRHGTPDSLLLLHLPRVGVVGLPIAPRERGVHWEWNGSRQSPTLSPSIRSDGGARGSWHGHLVDGQLREC